MGLFNKKTLDNRFAMWVDRAFSNEIRNDVVAINFNIYENNKNQWSIEIVGTSSFNENDENWACDEITDFGTRNAPFSWNESSDWKKVLDKTAKMIKKYLKKGKYADKIKKVNGIGTGFVDGNIQLIYLK